MACESLELAWENARRTIGLYTLYEERYKEKVLCHDAALAAFHKYCTEQSSDQEGRDLALSYCQVKKDELLVARNDFAQVHTQVLQCIDEIIKEQKKVPQMSKILALQHGNRPMETVNLDDLMYQVSYLVVAGSHVGDNDAERQEG